MKIRVTALVVAVLVSACTAQIPAFPTPPPLPAETIPLPPVSDEPLVWQPGDWTYLDGSYHYDPGHYLPQAGHGSNWAFGHWVGTRGNYSWVPGQWL